MSADKQACARRALALAETHAFAREILLFYRQIALFQYGLRGKRNPVTAFPELVALVEECGPKRLAETAARLRSRSEPDWKALLEDFRTAPPEEAFFAKVLLQPEAERMAQRSAAGSGSSPEPVCPFCQSKPVAGVLRPEGYGARRSLMCSFCSTEWRFSRLLCPQCGEQSFDRLPVYTAGELDYIRVEACDSCQTYVKTIDLTKNGLAVPLVDELASVPLDLWAQDRGYTKLELNLLGM